jgi:hypothetical protein
MIRHPESRSGGEAPQDSVMFCNPGGSPEHYGVVRYGTNPKELNLSAKNPIRLNPGHSYTVFRVRLDDLKTRTTYYYRVDSMEANGNGDGVKSPVNQFTTR